MSTPTFSRSQSIVFEVSDDRAVLMDTTGNEMITLNPVGTQVWTQLAEPRRLHDLVDALSSAHPDVPRATIESDIQAFLDELLEARLVERDAPS